MYGQGFQERAALESAYLKGLWILWCIKDWDSKVLNKFMIALNCCISEYVCAMNFCRME
jgi:hypothetical protein